MIPTIVVIRHGSTQFNSPEQGQERIRGWIDLPLTPRGRQESQATAHAVARQFPGIAQILTSDLQRAHETAGFLSQATGAKVAATARLRPWNLGDLQGQPVDAALPTMKALTALRTHPAPGGESYQNFLDRFLPLMRHVQVIADQSPGQPLVVVTHTRNLRALRGWLKQGSPASNDVDLPTVDAREEAAPAEGLVLQRQGLGGWRMHPLAHKPLDSPMANSAQMRTMR